MESKRLRSCLGSSPGNKQWRTSTVLQKFKKAFPFKYQIFSRFLSKIFTLSTFTPLKVFKKMGCVPVFSILLSVFSIIALSPKDSNAMQSFLTDLVAPYQTPTPTNQSSTCANCHNAWGGRETRNNMGVAYYIFDNTKAANSPTSKLSLNDADRDGYNNYTEFTYSQTTTQPGAATRWFASFPDKDGDGCIALYYRTDENGMPVPQDGIRAEGCVNGNVCYGVSAATKGFNSFTPIGWDIDDNDPAQGCVSWSSLTGPSATPATTTDAAPPGQITDIRYSGSLVSAQIPLTWTAVADDGTTGTNAYSYDIRYTTESLASAKTYCGGGTSVCNVRLASDWVIMWDKPDCDVDKSAGLYLAKSGTPGAGGAATASCGTSWNQGEIAPLMRALYEPVPGIPGNVETYSITMQGDTVSTINSAVYPNTITDGITYWIAILTSDGVLVPTGNAGDGTVDDPTGFIENISSVSNIIAITPGTSTTGAAIQSYTSVVGKSATSMVEVHGLGLGSGGIVSSARLYDATLGTITCSIDGPTRTNIYLKLTCNTSAATNGQYDLDLRNASSVTKAAWVDGVQITDANTTTIDDNTNPTNKYPAGGAANQAVSAFNISTNNGTDTVTQIQITRSGTGNASDISAVKLWRDVDQNMEYSAGDIQVGGTQTFSSNVATFSSLSEAVGTTSTKYIITFDIVASPTTEGTHYAAVSSFVSGNASRVNNDNTDAVLAIDWTAPTTSASATGYTFDTWTNSGSVSVSLTGSDNVSGVASTTYCVDNTNTCTPTTAYTAAVNVSCATTCVQYVRYKSTDNSNNAETVKSSIVKQDLQGPTDGTLTASPGDTQVVLNWTAATDSGSGLAGANTYKVVYQTGATAPANCTLGTQIYLGTALTYTHTSLTNSTQYSYRVCAYDAVNNVSTGATASATPASTPQTIASSGATATSNKYAKGGETNLAVGTFELKTNSGTDTVNQIVVSSSGSLANSNVASVRIFEDNGGGSANYEYDATDTLIGTSQTFSGTTATFGPSLGISVSTAAKKYIIVYNILASPSGNGTLQGRVSDITFTSANTKSVTDTADGTITVDITAPTAPSPVNDGSGADINYTSSTTSLQANWTASTDGGSGLNRYEYAIGTGTCGSANEVNTKTWTSTGTTASMNSIGLTLTNGTTYYVNVKAYDNAGNVSTCASSNGITVDTAAPSGTVSINSGNTYTNSTNVTLTLTCSDATSGCYQMRISNDGTFDTEVWETFAASKAWTIATGDGTKTVYVMFKDNAANETAAATTGTITLDTSAPSVSSTTPTSGATGVSVSTDVTANFTNGPIKCSTVTAGTTFHLRQGSTCAGTLVTATLQSCASTQAVLRPSAVLSGSTQYTACLTSGITDEAGNALTAYNWSFTTSAVSDTTAPTWNSTTGAQYVGDNGAGGKLVLCFNGATDASSPPASYFAYYNTTTPASGGTSVSIGSTPAAGDSASCGGSAYDYKYELTGLTNGTKYYITARARDSVGNYTTNEDNKTAIPYNRTLSVNGYNMISVPGELGAGIPTITLFSDDLSYLRVMGWNGSYTSASNITEGSGYWILNSTGDNTKKIDIDSVGGDNGSYTAYTLQDPTVGPIAVNKGWNLIGNPCLTNITGTNITVTLSATSASCGGTSTCTFAQAATGNFVRNTIYRWDGNNYTTDAPLLTTGGNAEPWKGYWLYVYNTTPYAMNITLTCGAQ